MNYLNAQVVFNNPTTWCVKAPYHSWSGLHTLTPCPDRTQVNCPIIFTGTMRVPEEVVRDVIQSYCSPSGVHHLEEFLEVMESLGAIILR